MFVLRRDVLLVAAAVLAVACEREAPVYELSGETMGTSYSVALAKPPEDTDFDSLKHKIEAQLATITSRMSTYEPDSELSRFNAEHSTDWQRVSAQLCLAIREAQAVSVATMGAFDITVGPLVDLWGFGPPGSRDTVPSAEEIEHALQSVGYRNLETNCDALAIRKHSPELRIDLSAFAKGLAVDYLSSLLDSEDLRNYVVEIGGEVRARGVNARGQAWRIAVERPNIKERGVQQVLNVSDKSVATSGDYRNYFTVDGKRYSHTIDPRTGAPVDHDLVAVTVVTSTAVWADGLATALLVLGPDEGLQFATDNSIAALFLVHRIDGVEALESPEFRAISQH